MRLLPSLFTALLLTGLLVPSAGFGQLLRSEGMIGASFRTDRFLTTSAETPPFFVPLDVHILLYPPQLGTAECSFRLRFDYAIPLSVTLGEGWTDTDSSEDGFVLRRDECVQGSDPVVLLSLTVLPTNHGTLVEVLSHEGTGLRAGEWGLLPTLSYRSCDEDLDLPLRLNPYTCEYDPPGSVTTQSGCLIGSYLTVPAVFSPPIATERHRFTIPLLVGEGSQIGKNGCWRGYDIPFWEFELTWDPEFLELEGFDSRWPMTWERLENGLARVQVDRTGPEQAGLRGTLGRALFRSEGRSGWTQIAPASVRAFDPDSTACWGARGYATDVQIGCTKGKVVEDGEINAGDAVMALRFHDGLTSREHRLWCAADMDADMVVERRDALAILRQATGGPEDRGRKRAQRAPVSETLNLTTAPLAGFQATIQVLPSETPFVDAVVLGGSGEFSAQEVAEDLLKLAFASAVSAPVAIDLHFAGKVVTPGYPRLTSFRAFDVDGREVVVPTPALGSDPVGAQAALGFPGIRAHPNPFNPRTTLRLLLTAAGPAEVAVFSASGRLVREILLGWMEPGERSIPWDGRDQDGKRLASGVYHVRLQSTDGARWMKVTLLR